MTVTAKAVLALPRKWPAFQLRCQSDDGRYPLPVLSDQGGQGRAGRDEQIVAEDLHLHLGCREHVQMASREHAGNRLPALGIGQQHGLGRQREQGVLGGVSLIWDEDIDSLAYQLWPGLVPLENRIRVVTCGFSGCQAAREYSLIRPPRTGFRWIRSRSRSATVRRPPSCSSTTTQPRRARPSPAAAQAPSVTADRGRSQRRTPSSRAASLKHKLGSKSDRDHVRKLRVPPRTKTPMPSCGPSPDHRQSHPIGRPGR
jgi:hypothetical protein